jgi:hypothetical protein
MNTMEAGRDRVWSTCERLGMHSRVVFGFDVLNQDLEEDINGSVPFYE